MKVTIKGQVTIPARIREYLGIYPHTNVDFSIAEGKVILVKPDTDPEESGRFLNMRGILKGELSTEKWMQATRSDW
ncbi:MAG: AbrB/MazE/SpoVT family DNA-binding domain-containing protein [Candidatus Auribacterota bacterium]|nr:AbrB/MazE/SpoVT family DNA-binding domain-containing protein [Candidatus Auribacterota bacterium]